MAGFTLRQNDKSPLIEVWTKSSSSDTGVVGDLYYFDAETDDALPGAAGTSSYERVGILLKDTINGDSKIKVQIPTPTQLWEATTASSSDSADTGHNMILSTQNTIDNAGSNSVTGAALIVQVDVLGASSDNRILVRFSQMGNGLANM